MTFWRVFAVVALVATLSVGLIGVRFVTIDCPARPQGYVSQLLDLPADVPGRAWHGGCR